jgi:flagellar basal body rod protein FlgF
MQQRELETRREMEALEKINIELTAKMNAMIAEKKQFELITQFVHRITDESPIPHDQLLSMLEESK